MTDSAESPVYRYDVAFETAEIEHGRSIVRLALSREDTPSAPSTALFFELKEGMTPEDTRLFAGFLNQYIARLGFNLPDGADAEEP